MEPDFWLSRWRENRTGWHQPGGHPQLRKWFGQLGLAPGAAVFVPLCGKSADLLWLAAQGYTAVGVELSPLAVDALLKENALARPRRESRDGFEIYETQSLRLLCGDFFALSAGTVGAVEAAYDRAALIALPPRMRAAYAKRLQALLGSGARVLLLTLEYDQTQMEGPPFSVPGAEVHALFEPGFEVRLLERVSVLSEEPRFREQGLAELHEATYLLSRRG